MKVKILFSKEIQAIGILEDFFGNEDTYFNLGFLNENLLKLFDFYKKIALSDRKKIYFEILEGRVKVPFEIISFEKYEKELKEFSEKLKETIDKYLDRALEILKEILNIKKLPEEILLGVYYKFFAKYLEGHAIVYNNKVLILIGYSLPFNEKFYFKLFFHELLHALLKINDINLKEKEEEFVEIITKYVIEKLF